MLLLMLRRRGYGPPPVHYVGKTATFILLIALPGAAAGPRARAAARLGRRRRLGLALWGLVLYWVAAIFYVIQVSGAVRESRA